MVKVLDAELDIASFAAVDIALNGLQVGSHEKEVKKVALAVDASLATFKAAASWGADAIMVHHGLFWGQPLALTGAHHDRVKFLMDNDIALYAAHLPLDAHPTLGNNACIARKLGIDRPVPFGLYKGVRIGFKGILATPVEADEIAARLGYDESTGLKILTFGPRKIRSIGIVSGGAADDVHDALADGLDAFLTGEALHQVYHDCMENGITMICGGHYATETLGVQAVGHFLAEGYGVDASFIAIPTGL
ncbi:Nif3-like dinuclear metal center hexameric protein [Parasphaerochaeta coccoides]